DNLNVTYKELIGHERDGIAEYYNGKLRKYFSVAQLLKGIKPPDSDGPHGKGDYHLHLHQDTYNEETYNDHSQTYNDNSITQNITVNLPKLRNSFRDIQRMLKGEFPELAEDIQEVNDELRLLDTDCEEKQLISFQEAY
ncbi:MAG: hypothetical protein GY757_25680, partial [bacterium]|nr:hypothetical protein [bacterium]